MIKRREFLKWSAAGAAAMLVREAWSAEAPTLLPAQPRVRVAFDIPAGAVDTHVHIVGSTARFPYVAKRAYTPPEDRKSTRLNSSHT